MNLAQLQERLNAYLAAETAILQSQEYSIDGRRLRRADLEQVRAEIASLQGQVDKHADNPNRTRRRGVVYLRPY